MPETFYKFRKLPPEQRWMIWDLAATPRLLHLKYNHQSKTLTLEDRCHMERVPPLLQVCQESRLVSSRRYTLLVLNPSVKSHVYIDFAADTVYFGRSLYRHWFRPAAACEDRTGKVFSLSLGARKLFRHWFAGRGSNANLIQRVAIDARFYVEMVSRDGRVESWIFQLHSLNQLSWVVPLDDGMVFNKSRTDEFGFETVPAGGWLDAICAETPDVLDLMSWDDWEHKFSLVVDAEQLRPLSSTYFHHAHRFPGRSLYEKGGIWEETTMRVVGDWDIFPRRYYRHDFG